MAQPVQAWKCSYCGKTDKEEVIKQHEPKCKKEQQANQRRYMEYDRKREKRFVDAVEIAQQSPGIKLLVKAGLLDDAETLCRDKAHFLWDCGTSSGWTEVYAKMISSVK